MPRFSANLHFLFNEHGFLDRFAAARRAGFDGVEFPDPYSFPLAALRARLVEQSLACVLINLPMGNTARGDKGLACLPERVAEFRAGVDLAVAAAVALGCPRANCLAGIPPAGADLNQARATLVANLRHAAQAFQHAGLTLCLEALNTEDVPGFFLSGSRQVIDLIGEVGAENLRFQLDLYHMQVMEKDLLATIDRSLPLVEHVQFADAPGRHEPGTGQIAFQRVFDHLDQRGYRGWVSAEYHPSRATEQTLSWYPGAGPHSLPNA